MAEKDVTGVNGQSKKPGTFKWEMHTFWKELSREGIETAPLISTKSKRGALWVLLSGARHWEHH